MITNKIRHKKKSTKITLLFNPDSIKKEIRCFYEIFLNYLKPNSSERENKLRYAYYYHNFLKLKNTLEKIDENLTNVELFDDIDVMNYIDALTTDCSQFLLEIARTKNKDVISNFLKLYASSIILYLDIERYNATTEFTDIQASKTIDSLSNCLSNLNLEK